MSREIRTTSSTGGQKGVKLERHDLIPQGPLKLLAEHFGKGAQKYDAHQWRNGYEWSKSYSAAQRHFSDFWAGYDYDVCSNRPDECLHEPAPGQAEVLFFTEDTCYAHTGSHHLVAAAWHCFVMLEFTETHPEHDDRYIINTPEPDQDELTLFDDFDIYYNRVATPPTDHVGTQEGLFAEEDSTFEGFRPIPGFMTDPRIQNPPWATPNDETNPKGTD